MLNWPLASFASNIEQKADNKLIVTREVDNGLQKLLVELPCVISCDLRLNTPRHISLKHITAVYKI